MANEDFVLSNMLFKILVFVAILFFIVTYFGSIIKKVCVNIFGRLFNAFTAFGNKFLGKYKEKLFSNLLETARRGKPMTILEVGAGSGANFQYYPANSAVICVEPKKFFGKFIDENASKHPNLRVEFVEGVAEDMQKVPSGSVDAVVMTLVLCTVQNMCLSLQEVLRVLKPVWMSHAYCQTFQLNVHNSN